MKAEEILKRLAELNSIYGMGARQSMQDPALAAKFVCECYKEINENPEGMRKHFGSDLVDEILGYVNESNLCD